MEKVLKSFFQNAILFMLHQIHKEQTLHGLLSRKMKISSKFNVGVKNLQSIHSYVYYTFRIFVTDSCTIYPDEPFNSRAFLLQSLSRAEMIIIFYAQSIITGAIAQCVVLYEERWHMIALMVDRLLPVTRGYVVAFIRTIRNAFCIHMTMARNTVIHRVYDSNTVLENSKVRCERERFSR